MQLVWSILLPHSTPRCTTAGSRCMYVHAMWLSWMLAFESGHAIISRSASCSERFNYFRPKWRRINGRIHQCDGVSAASDVVSTMSHQACVRRHRRRLFLRPAAEVELPRSCRVPSQIVLTRSSKYDAGVVRLSGGAAGRRSLPLGPALGRASQLPSL